MSAEKPAWSDLTMRHVCEYPACGRNAQHILKGEKWCREHVPLHALLKQACPSVVRAYLGVVGNNYADLRCGLINGHEGQHVYTIHWGES